MLSSSHTYWIPLDLLTYLRLQWRSQGLPGRAAHPEDQNEEENEENLRKMRIRSASPNMYFPYTTGSASPKIKMKNEIMTASPEVRYSEKNKKDR